MWSLSPIHFDHASRVVREHLQPTPLEERHGLLLKLETRQETGSFKVRGALSKLSSLTPEERARGVVAASAGNHGLGVAWAAKKLGIDAVVVVPTTSPDVKRAGIRALGARLLVEGDSYDLSEDEARGVAAKEDRVFVSPYDDAYVAAGNGGTLADELPSEVTTVVVPVGGGGLIIGLATRLHGVRIVGVQSEASPVMALSLARGAAITRFVGGPTLAEGLEGGVSESAFHHVRALGVEIVTVSEREIAEAMGASTEKIEGSAAVALAWARRETRPACTCVILTGRNVA